jgi:hypothetical protein
MVKSSDPESSLKLKPPTILSIYFYDHMQRNPLDVSTGRTNIKIRAARLYSDVFSPPSAFAIFGFILAWSELSFWRGTLHAVIFGSLSSLLPLGYILILLNRGVINDIHLSNMKDRKNPYILGILGAILAYIILSWMGTSILFLNYILTNIIGLALLAIINSRWLISAHTSTISAITTFAGFAFPLPVVFAISPLVILTPIIRYYLKRHTLGELISGALVGIGSVLVLVLFGFFDGYYSG